jgi:hypothetical protein
MKKLAILGIILMASLSIVSLSAQCPMCKTALKSNLENKSKSTKPVGGGINKGILFLLSAPYVLAGTAGFLWYKNSRSKK